MFQGFFPRISKNSRLFQIIILFCLGICLLVGCGEAKGTLRARSLQTETSPSSSKDRVTVGTTLKPRTIDPADSYDLAGILVVYNLGETLYSYKLGTTELEPRLAIATPKMSADGLVYRIPLRQGVKFHDGTPFNAAAMVFSLNRFIQNAGEPSFLLSDTIDKVKALGEWEIEITLKKPFSAFPALLAFPGACAVSPQAYEIGEGKFKPESFVGTGPYQLTQFNSDSLHLKAFADYWGEKPKNQGINLQLYPSNPANLFNAFRTQTIDVAYQSLMAQQIKTLKADASREKYKVIESSGSVINFMALNMRTDVLRQVLVRKAIATLIDRKLLIDRILQGQGEALYSMIPLGFSAYQPVFQTKYGDAKGTLRARNLEQAKQWLKEAGFSRENPVKIEVWHSSGSITNSIVAALLKALSQRDLDNAIQFEPNSIAGAAYFKNVSKGLYESTISNWYPDFLDPDNYIFPFLHCAKGSLSQGCEEGGARNQGSFYYNPKMNQLIDQQRRELDPQKRDAIFAEIQTILAADVPYIPLWQTKDFAFAQQNITGTVINPSQTFPFWTLGKS